MTVEIRPRKGDNQSVVIIEAGFSDEWSRLNLIERPNFPEIPRFTATLKTGDEYYTYVLYPKNPERWPKRETRVGDPAAASLIFNNIRALVLRDGRVFVRTDMLKDENYLEIMLPNLVEEAKNYFEKPIQISLPTLFVDE